MTIRKATGISQTAVHDFQALPGNGLSAVRGEDLLLGGSVSYMKENVTVDSTLLDQAQKLAEEGKTPLLFAKNHTCAGLIAVADTLKEDSPQAVAELRDMGIRVIMLTGDNERTAKAIAQKNNGKIPDEQLKRLQDEFDKALHSQTEAIRTALQENKDNLIPASMIAFYSENIGMDKVEEYLKEYAYKDNGILKNVNNYIQALKRKAVGAMFTDFTMNDMQGTPRKLSDYVGKGNYVLVDFWASWCGPCRAEMPNVKKAYEQFHPKGFEIVGISFDAQKDAWQKATTQLGITWPQMSDLKAWNCEAGAIYGIRSIPATILFGPDGKIVATDLRGEELQKKLEEIYP